jgi:UDPglucose 6-dehydrogenase
MWCSSRLARHPAVATVKRILATYAAAPERFIRQEPPAADVAIVSNPEFLRERAAIQDFKHLTPSWLAPRIHVPVRSWTSCTGRSISMRFRSCTSNRRTAELIKDAANAYLVV